jgi:hypothetical protein
MCTNGRWLGEPSAPVFWASSVTISAFRQRSPQTVTGVGNWRQKGLRHGPTHKGREREGAGVGLLCDDDEISVLARLRTKALIGDEQGGARGYQRGNALKRFRREFDTVKRVGGGSARGIGG